MDGTEAHGRGLSLRERAEARLHRRQDFAIHVSAYLSLNVLLVAIWAYAGGGEFWPTGPIVVWGIWLAIHGLSVYGPGAAVEDPIAKEMDRLRDRGAAG